MINVVLGDMSLVGPRPAPPVEVAECDSCAGRPLAVRPGLTALWKIGGRSDLSWERAVELDLVCTDDLVVGVRTVGAVLGGRGAY